MILIHAVGTRQKNGDVNAKTYPYWPELLKLLRPRFGEVTQVGIKGDQQLVKNFKANLSIAELTELLQQSDLWVSIDSFLPHLAHHCAKPGVVLWGPSDPLIYGYPENLNLLKDRSLLRKDQFGIWDGYPFDPRAFVEAREAANQIEEYRRVDK